MGTYVSRLKGRQEIVKGTVLFTFEKPTDFAFKAGQYMNVAFLESGGKKGNSHCFSITAAPYENDLAIATRVRESSFKRRLNDLPIGTEVQLTGPGGSFLLHSETSIPAVFLTGGIGITPVRSMLLQAAKEKVNQQLILFYSNESPEKAAFLNELSQIAKNLPSCRLIATMTKPDRPWSGERGRIDKAMLLRYVPDLEAPIYYICGPGAMVADMQQVLEDAGVSNDKIRTEEFPGY